MPVVLSHGFAVSVGRISRWVEDGTVLKTWSFESLSATGRSGKYLTESGCRAHTRQDQCQVIRYLDERGHVSENVCKVHLVMTIVSAERMEFSESLGLSSWGN